MRVHLRTVSPIGHSHAVSMWAWPVAMTWWALARAGHGRAHRRRRPAPGRPGRRNRPAGRPPRRGRARWRPGCGPGEDRRAAARASRRRGRRGRAAGPRRRRRRRPARPAPADRAGVLPAVAGEPSGVGRNCTRIGFDAASTTSSTGPGSPGTASAWRRGWMPCTGRPFASRTRPSHWKPGESARKPRSRRASTRRPDQAAGTVPVKRNHVVPHGGPQRCPTANGARSSGVGPASTTRGTRSGCTSGSTRSVSSRVMRSSSSSRSSCTTDIVTSRPPHGARSSLPACSQVRRRCSSPWTRTPPSTTTRRTTTAASSSTSPRSSAGAGCWASSPAASAPLPSPPADWPARRVAARPARARRATTAADGSSGTLTETPEETAGPYPGDGSNGVNVLTESGIVRSDIRSSFGSSTTTAPGVPADDHDQGRRPDRRRPGRPRRLPVALRPRRQVLALHRCERELPPRRPGDGERRHGDVHVDLPGLLRRPLAAHPLRGVPDPGVGDERLAARRRRRRSRCPRTSARSSTPPAATSRAWRTCRGVSLTTDMVFSDSWQTELGTVTGDTTNGYTCTLTACCTAR